MHDVADDGGASLHETAIEEAEVAKAQANQAFKGAGPYPALIVGKVSRTPPSGNRFRFSSAVASATASYQLAVSCLACSDDLLLPAKMASVPSLPVRRVLRHPPLESFGAKAKEDMPSVSALR